MQKLADPGFGKIIRERREELGLTQAQLISKIDAAVSLRTLINIENHDAVPRVKTLVKIAAALDLDLVLLMVSAAEVPS